MQGVQHQARVLIPHHTSGGRAASHAEMSQWICCLVDAIQNKKYNLEYKQ